MAVWNVNKPSWKMIRIFSPVNEWHAIAIASPHKITNVGYVKNIYLQPLAVGWISIEGCGKVQFERPFSGVSFGDHENGWIGKFYF